MTTRSTIVTSLEEITSWQPNIAKQKELPIVQALESGQVVFLPNLDFKIQEDEHFIFNTNVTNGKSKNISFDPKTKQLKGQALNEECSLKITGLMERYARDSKHLVDTLFPHYKGHIQQAKTSLRPIEAKGRTAPSYRKDDTRLHVDAFPSNPNQGARILRVFTNINPNDQARHWRVGEHFTDVAQRFAPEISAPLPLSAEIMNLLGVTKSKRSPYDHYMLHIHHQMKKHEPYQKHAIKGDVYWPAHSTWICYTDSVSHAALEGQYCLEQTFNLNAAHMQDPTLSPLSVLEKLLSRKLV
jgi:hypothetical protein